MGSGMAVERRLRGRVVSMVGVKSKQANGLSRPPGARGNENIRPREQPERQAASGRQAQPSQRRRRLACQRERRPWLAGRQAKPGLRVRECQSWLAVRQSDRSGF